MKKILLRIKRISQLFCIVFSATNLASCASLTSREPWQPLEIANSCNKVAMSNSHVLMANDKGELYAWGVSAYGQLGDPTIQHSFRPVKIKTINDVKCVAAGSTHSVVVKNDGTVWQWGSARMGGLGFEDKNNWDPVPPTLVKEIQEPAVGVSANGRLNLVLTESGEIYSWGANDVGQLGHGSINGRETSMKVRSQEDFAFVEAGVSVSYAITKQGKLWAWGSNRLHHVSELDQHHFSTPQIVEKLNDVVKVSGGFFGVTALTANGKVWSWGENKVGQLGLGYSSEIVKTPTQIEYDGRALDIDGRFLIAENGAIWRWGPEYLRFADLKQKRLFTSASPSSLFSFVEAKKVYTTRHGNQSPVGIFVDENDCLQSWGNSSAGIRGDGTHERPKILFNNSRAQLKTASDKLLCIRGK